MHRIEMGIFDLEESDDNERDPEDENHDGENNGDENENENENEGGNANENDNENEIENENRNDEEAGINQDSAQANNELPAIQTADILEVEEDQDAYVASPSDPSTPASDLPTLQHPQLRSRSGSPTFSHHGVMEDDNFSAPSSPITHSAPESSSPETDHNVVPMVIDQEGVKPSEAAPYVWTDEEL